MTTAMRLVTLTQIGVIGAATLGCATTSRGVDPVGDAVALSSTASIARDPSIARPSRQADALTAVELAAVPMLAHATAYDALLQLRPSFLHQRNPRTGNIAARGVVPAVFINGGFAGEVDVLRFYTVATIAEIQYIRSFDAVHRFGPDYSAGVILVYLRR